MGDDKNLEKLEVVSQEKQKPCVKSSASLPISLELESGYSSLSLIWEESYDGDAWACQSSISHVDTRSDLSASLLSQENVEELLSCSSSSQDDNVTYSIFTPQELSALEEKHDGVTYETLMHQEIESKLQEIESKLQELESQELESQEDVSEKLTGLDRLKKAADKPEKLTGLARLRSLQPPSHHHVLLNNTAVEEPCREQVPTPQSIDSYVPDVQARENASTQNIGLPTTWQPNSARAVSELEQGYPIEKGERKRGWKPWGGIVRGYQESMQRLQEKSFHQTEISCESQLPLLEVDDGQPASLSTSSENDK